MDAKVSSEFWSDPAVENLTPEQKLAALWCITGGRTNLLGFVEVSRRRYEFETGSPYEGLTSLTEAHSKGFKKCGAGIWIRRFIAHQFGTGNSLVKNNFCKPLLNELRACEGLPVFQEVLTEYPELQEAYDERFSHDLFEGLSKGLPSPREEKRRTEESREEQNPPKTVEIDPLLQRVRALFGTRPSTPVQPKVAEIWKKNRAAVLATPDEDWQLLEWWYQQPDGEGQIAQYRKTTTQFLLTAWTAEIEKARIAARKSGYAAKKGAAAEKLIPDGWRDLIAEADPEYPLPETFLELPESGRAWVWDLWRQKNTEGGQQ